LELANFSFLLSLAHWLVLFRATTFSLGLSLALCDRRVIASLWGMLQDELMQFVENFGGKFINVKFNFFAVTLIIVSFLESKVYHG
jgi:hypothetical protein